MLKLGISGTQTEQNGKVIYGCPLRIRSRMDFFVGSSSFLVERLISDSIWAELQSSEGFQK